MQRLISGLVALIAIAAPWMASASHQAEALSLSSQQRYGIDYLNDDNFDKTIAEGDCLVDFYADWCGPCRRFGPVFEKVSSEFPNVAFYKFNVDQGKKVSAKVEAKVIPTVIAFRKGKEVSRKTGSVTEAEFRAFVQQAFPK